MQVPPSLLPSPSCEVSWTGADESGPPLESSSPIEVHEAIYDESMKRGGRALDIGCTRQVEYVVTLDVGPTMPDIDESAAGRRSPAQFVHYQLHAEATRASSPALATDRGVQPKRFVVKWSMANDGLPDGSYRDAATVTLSF